MNIFFYTVWVGSKLIRLKVKPIKPIKSPPTGQIAVAA